jgi:hypothetical protein
MDLFFIGEVSLNNSFEAPLSAPSLLIDYIRHIVFYGILCAHSRIRKGLQAFMAHGVPRLNCPAASTTVPAMKKSIILVSALSVVVMALVSCASDSDVNPYRVNTDTPTTTPYHEPAPAHSNVGGVGL